MDDQQERALAAGLRQGQADAWRGLYDAYAEQVWRSVARLLGPQSADVADVVQETFMAAARSARTYEASKGTLWFWLWGIARKHVALHYRKQERYDRLKHATEWLAAGNGQMLRWLGGREATPPEQMQTAELATLVRTTLAELPADYEILLTARYLDDTPVETLAQRERSTGGAIRSKLARAREAFRQAFGKYAGAAGEPSKRPL